MYGQENINEQWGEETAAEYLDYVRGYDGTERKDDVQYNFGGIIGGLNDGYEPDTADRDYFVRNKIDGILYNAAADALEGRRLSKAAAKEVAADAIATAVAECKKDYEFHDYDTLIAYNLDAALIDYVLGIIK